MYVCVYIPDPSFSKYFHYKKQKKNFSKPSAAPQGKMLKFSLNFIFIHALYNVCIKSSMLFVFDAVFCDCLLL